MILTAMGKFISDKKRNKYTLVFFFFFGCFISLQAQKFSIQLDSITLSEALANLSAEQGIKVAFDADRLKNIIINKKVTGNTFEELMQNLLENTGFSFEFKHETFLVTEALSPKAVVDFCNVTGSVTDYETGEQLAFATLLLPAEKVNLLAASNGSFFYKHSGSSLFIHATYIGYEPLDTLVQVKPPLIVCDLRLKRRYQEFDTLVVKSGGQEMVDFRDNVDFATTINMAKLADMPQFTGSDMFRTMQLLPGVSYTETSSELSIRGGSSDQNLVLYDGQTLYNLSHFFGMFSALNPSIIKDIQIYKGGFDSRYGERVSGIIDITSKSGNQAQPSVYGDINLISGSLAAEIPITPKFTVVAAGRRSYADIYSTGLTQAMADRTVVKIKGDQENMSNISKPLYYFYDYNVKLTYRLNTRENMSVSIYGGYDSYNNSYASKNKTYDISTSDETLWGNYGFSVLWQKQWNGALYSDVLLSSSGYTSDYGNTTDVTFLRYREHPNHKYLPDSVNKFDLYSTNELSDRAVQVRNIWFANSTHQVNFGAMARFNKIVYHKDADRVYVYDSINQSSVLLSAYIQDKIMLNSKLTIKPGLRANYFNSGNGFYLEPRLSVSYQVNEHLGFRAAAGNYCQFISKVLSHQETGYYKSFWLLSDERDYPVLKSKHYVIGGTFERGRFLVDVETYFKTFNGIQEYIFVSQFLKNSDFKDIFKKDKKKDKKNPKPEEPPQPSYFINGSGKSMGADLMVRYTWHNFISFLSYTFGHTTNQFENINNNEEFPAITDNAHQLSLGNLYAWRKWNFGSVVLFSSGRPYYIFNNFNGRNQQATLKRDFARMQPYFRTDISANYAFKVSQISCKAGITLVNLLNNNNYFDINNRKFDFDNALFSETNLVRSQGRSINIFFVFKY